jgi:hypothetical protein
MIEWWKDPRLDDEGTYDYLVEPLPKDYAKWDISKYKWKCDNCGKESHVRFVSEHYFYCWDGWDSMSYDECWKCRLKGNISGLKWKIKRFVKKHVNALKNAREFQKASSTGSFKYWYKVSMKLEK